MKIGIDLGGSHIGVALVNNQSEIIAQKEHDWNKQERENFFVAIEVYCREMIKQLLIENQVNSIEKIGIGFPSKNILNGIVYEKEKKFNLPSILENEFHVPTYLKNDVKCAALCEKKLGSLKKFSNCLFITLGTGIGGAYFYQNELVIPNTYQGLEVGHMIIEKNGKRCRCGRNGCFEEYASMRILREKIEREFEVKEITYEKVNELLENESTKEKMNAIIAQYIDNLAIGLSNLIFIFEPDAISIGGSFIYFSSILMEKLKLKLKEIFKNRKIPDIVIAEYGNNAGMIGASMLENN